MSGTVLGRGASGITRAIDIPTSKVFRQNNHCDDTDNSIMTVAVKLYHSSDITPNDSMRLINVLLYGILVTAVTTCALDYTLRFLWSQHFGIITR